MTNRAEVGAGARIPLALAAAVGLTAIGLLTTPIAVGQEPAQCPDGQFQRADGEGCMGVPDPTKYGCPPQDFKCMFDKVGPPTKQRAQPSGQGLNGFTAN